jgi:cob(I)alamin adenosyltransferase
MKIPDLKESDISLLENEIDLMNEVLAPMKFFVLPGGHLAVSQTHIARCVCRRAERCCVNMQEQAIFVDPLVIKYLNRLSDYLFVLSRYFSHQLEVPEIPWKPRV